MSSTMISLINGVDAMGVLTTSAPHKKVFNMRTWHALFGGFLLTTLVGCQSMNSSSPSTTDAELSAKQQDYETLLQEWQTLKPGITRLLAIEEELNALLGELERLQGSLASAQQQTAVTAAAPAPGRASPCFAVRPETP